MPARSRRALLASVAGLSLFGGCLSESTPGSDPPDNPQSTRPPTSDEPPSTDDPGTTVSDGTVRVESIEVADFFEYALAGSHPHVHNAAETTFVLVSVATRRDEDAIRSDLSVTLDGEELQPATRQPVPWERDTVDLAYRVSKDREVGAGRVAFQGTTLAELPASAIETINEPPRFSVANLRVVRPAELEAGASGEATVAFDVTNEGPGDGTFGASVKGNAISGATTVTAPVDAGTTLEVTGSSYVGGSGDAATVTVDWGFGEETLSIPVVGGTTAASSVSGPSH